MWIKRDFGVDEAVGLPLKVLKGPRQVGKTSLLTYGLPHRALYFDDLSVRTLAQDNPKFFFDQFTGPLILDEATLAPNVFLELKRRVDAQRREGGPPLDIWMTASNQTLLQRNVRESLAGRASYFDLNTLSIHELGTRYSVAAILMRGGWPELYGENPLDPARYLNDLIATFIEKDIVAAAGVERKQAFTTMLRLVAGRVGQLFNASDLARNVGVDVTTVQAWCAILESNGILRRLESHHANRNQRLIKAPKYYLEDVGLAVRLQGWSQLEPLLLSPAIGSLIENLALNEITRFFLNRGELPRVSFVRNKEKVEIDFLIELDNQRFVAAEVKMRASAMTAAQTKMLSGLGLNLIERWSIAASEDVDLPTTRTVSLEQIWPALERLCKAPA